MSQFACQSIESAKAAGERGQSDEINFSKNIYDALNVTGYPGVLQMPSNAEHATNVILKVTAQKEGHYIMGADAAALVVSSYNRPGHILVLDNSNVRSEAIRYAFRSAVLVEDYTLWKTFMEGVYPNTRSYLRAFITAQNFDTLLVNIRSNKIIFVNSDLSALNAHTDISKFLREETGHSSIALIHTPYLEADISKKIVTQYSNYENVTFEKELILERRQMALENFHNNIKALTQKETLFIENENSTFRMINKAQFDGEWHVHPFTPLEFVSKEVSEGTIISKTYYMARELQNSFRNILRTHLEVTANHIPLLDTLEQTSDRLGVHWNLSLVDVSNPELPPLTIKTREPIFQQIKAFVQKITFGHVTKAGSTAMDLIFTAEAICHWIENGFTPDFQGMKASKSLIAALQIHFYVNMVSVVHSLIGFSTGVFLFSIEQGIKGALSISALKPFVQTAIALLKITKSGRILMSLGSNALKAFPVIGLVLNAADFGLNTFELFSNDDPYQKPVLITSLVFSTAGLAISVGAVAATVAGISSLAGPLAIAGIAIATVAVLATHFVKQFSSRIQIAHSIGSIIKAIAKELKQGGYEKREEQKYTFLAAPSYVAITKLELSSNSLRTTYGGMEYLPSSLKPNNNFFDRFQADPVYFMNSMQSNIQIDKNYRSIIMPHVPEYLCTLSEEWVPFSSSRDDAEFKEAKLIQQVDPGFKFQVSKLGLADEIASSFSMYYRQTDITIDILESDWNLIFPNVDDGKENSPNSTKDRAEELNKSLRKISYDIIARSSGKQTILLPSLACSIKIRLHCQHVKVNWFIEFSDQSISNKDLKVEAGSIIKIGDNQHIELLGQASKTYILLPKYQDSETKYCGRAYFDVAKNHYIYNKDATNEEQAGAKLIFSSGKFAYFYQGDVKNATNGEIWCVQIDEKKSIFKHRGVKQLQKQGDGLVFIDNRGIFYNLSADLTGERVNCQIIGFNEEWFSQQGNPSKALNDADVLLEGNPRNQVIFFRLPYHTNQSLVSNILYSVETKKYYILNAKYVNQPKFLRFDAVNQNAYYHAFSENELIGVKGLTQEETARKLLTDQNKTQVHPDEPCEILLRGAVKAYVGENGVRVLLSSGLLVNFYERLDNDIPQPHINIEKIHVLSEEFENKAEHEVSSILQDKRSFLETKHIGESVQNRVQINLPDLTAIEYNRENIGFYEKLHGRTLSANKLPKADSIRITPLGTDEGFAYHILNGNQIVKTNFITKLKELKTSEKSLKDEALPFLQGETIELFDHVLFLKKDSLEDDFSNKLTILAKMPSISTVRLESKKYNLKMRLLENITISSINLSEEDRTRDIRLELNLFDGYYLQRDFMDLYLYNPQRNFYFIFKGVFERETDVPTCAGVSLITQDSELDAFSIPKILNVSAMLTKYEAHNTPIFSYDTPSYPRVDVTEFLLDKKTLEELVGKSNGSGQTVVHVLLQKQNFEFIKTLMRDITDILGTQVLSSLLAKTDGAGSNSLHYMAMYGTHEAFKAFWEEIQEKLEKERLKQMLLKKNDLNQTSLNILSNRQQNNSVQFLLASVQKFFGKETVDELLG